MDEGDGDPEQGDRARDVVRYVPWDADEPWPEEDDADESLLPAVWPWAEEGQVSVRSQPQVAAMWLAVDTWWGPPSCPGSVSVSLPGTATCSEEGCDGVGGHDIGRVVACSAGMPGLVCPCWWCADG